MLKEHIGMNYAIDNFMNFGFLVHELSQTDNNKREFILIDTNYAFQLISGLEIQKIIGTSLEWMSLQLNLQSSEWFKEVLDITNFKSQKDILCEDCINDKKFRIETKFINDKYIVTTFISENCTNNCLNTQSIHKETFTELEMIFNSSQDAMFLVKEDNGKFVYVTSNQMHQQLTGFTTENIIGRTPVEILGYELGLKYIDNFSKCLKTGKSMTFEENIMFKATETLLLTKISPVTINEELKYVVGSRVDITELMSLNKEKDELLSQLKSMFELHNAVQLLIDPDSGLIVDANPSATKFYGYSHDELISMTIQDINVLPRVEIHELRQKAFERHQKYFFFPHRLKNGDLRYVDVYSCPIVVSGRNLLYSIIFDVTDKQESKEELFREKELLNITFNSIGDGVVTTDTDGKITRTNKASLEILGCDSQEVIGKKFSDIFVLKSEITGEISPDIINYVLKTGEVQEMANHTVLVNRKGKVIPIADSAAPILDENRKIHGAVMVFRDVSVEKEKEDKILYLSYHDTLTGLFNRRFFDEELLRIDHPSAYPLAIVMGDVNGLKITNDVFGHEYGDQLLKSIAQIIKNNTNSTDIAIRWGGDEFVIFMPHTCDDAVEGFLAKIKMLLDKNSINDVIKTNVSFGYSIKENNDTPIEIFLQEAEEKMYRMKLMDSKSLRSSIINAILVTLYERSSETKEHSSRLEKYCIHVGKELSLKVEELSELSLLSVLHDIGKIGVDQNVLQKPGALTEEEWMEMRRHSEIGYRIASSIPEISNVSEHILYHHERWDGRGYPKGLKATEIPLNCRILAVADSYDAMISDRVYRKALSHEAAISELKRNAGTQFDPLVVDIFIKHINRDKKR